MGEHSHRAAAEKWFNRVLPLLPTEEVERTGGYFSFYSLTDIGDGPVYSITGFRVGTVPTEKEDRYRTFSAEKLLRLSMYPRHKSSFESQDPANNQWPGAVRGKEYLRSFSGLPWKGDEAISLACAVDGGDLTSIEALDIATTSGNEIYRSLCDQYEELRAPLP